jgi:hypothetical protein
MASKGTISASRMQHISQILQVPVPFFFEGTPAAPRVPPAARGTAEAPFPSYLRHVGWPAYDLHALPERPCQHLLHGLDAVDGLVRCEARLLERLAVIERTREESSTIRMRRRGPCE